MANLGTRLARKAYAVFYLLCIPVFADNESAAAIICEDSQKSCHQTSSAGELDNRYQALFNRLSNEDLDPGQLALVQAAAALKEEAEFAEARVQTETRESKLVQALAILEQLNLEVNERDSKTIEEVKRLIEENAFQEAIDSLSQIKPSSELSSQAESLQRRIDLILVFQNETQFEINRLLLQNEPIQALAMLNEVDGFARGEQWHELHDETSQRVLQSESIDLVSKGYAALANGDGKTAIRRFEAALIQEPSNVGAQRGLDEAKSLDRDQQVRISRLALTAAETAEDWEQARAHMLEIRSIRENPSLYGSEIDRVEQWIRIENKLDGFIASPGSLSDPNQRHSIRDFLDSLTGSYGTRIDNKVGAANHLFMDWTTPVTVTLRSDNKTDVRISPGRSLGMFRQITLTVFPGSYEIIGRRDGFHEVAHTIKVLPNDPPIDLTVKADERF